MQFRKKAYKCTARPRATLLMCLEKYRLIGIRAIEMLFSNVSFHKKTVLLEVGNL